MDLPWSTLKAHQKTYTYPQCFFLLAMRARVVTQPGLVAEVLSFPDAAIRINGFDHQCRIEVVFVADLTTQRISLFDQAGESSYLNASLLPSGSVMPISLSASSKSMA